MRLKTRNLSIMAVLTFLLVIVVKVCIAIYADKIIDTIVSLENHYGYDFDVVGHIYNNYITLMKVETIGLTIGLLVGYVLISIAFFLKIQNSNNQNELYRKIFCTIFGVVNSTTIVLVMFTLFSEYVIFYTIIKFLLYTTSTLVIFDCIVTIIKSNQTILSVVKAGLTIMTLIAVVFGINMHFDEIFDSLEDNEELIQLQLDMINTYYDELIETYDIDREYIEILIAKHMYVYEEFHTNKGYLVGINNLVVEAYKYILARDNVSTLYTTLTEEQVELYTKFTSDYPLNYPLLLSLIGGLIVVVIGMLLDESPKDYYTLTNELVQQLEKAKTNLNNGLISQEEYLELKEFLFNNY